MKIVIKKPQYNIIEILYASYLVNVFYLRNWLTINKILTWGIALCYLLLNSNRIISIVKKNKQYISKYSLIVIPWIIIIITSPLLHGTGDFTYFNTLETMIGTTLFLFVIVIIADRNKGSLNLCYSFMNLFIYSIVSYVFFTTLCLLFPSLKAIIINSVYISQNNMNLLNLRKYATRIGWAGFSGYSVSLKCTIANLFVLYFIVCNYVKMNKQKLKYYFLYIITLVGEFYYSRTGLITALCILIITILYTVYLKNILSTVWFFIAVSIVVLSIPFLQELASTNRSIAWILEPFLNFLSDDGFTTTSSTHLLSSMLFKLNLNQLIWGDGMYTGQNGYYMKTDLGFMRLILYCGIPGLLMTYAQIMFSLKNITAKNIEKISVWFVLSLLITFALFEFKGESIIFMIPILFVVSLVSS